MSRFVGRIKWNLIPAVALLVLLPGSAVAQGVAIPNFWDPRAAMDKPDLTGFRPVRFLVDDDFPPLAFVGPDGNPTGFSIELSRALCEKLALTCTLQVRRFNMLLDALADRQGDVVAAGFPISAALRQRFLVTNPYFKIPARFAARKDRRQPEPTAGALAGKTVGVLGGTAHEAYLKAFLPGATLKAFDTLPNAQAALKAGEVDYLFADGLNLSLWLGGVESADCCAFVGGPYLESRFFGEGIGLVVRQDDEVLRRALDYGLQQLWKDGKYAELYLRFFPVSPF
ncbi:transporter substrate-binding domain-containing protein [Microvirga pudoricolor]|uniref:transporter substrate-binding domain-containing protein n=1 Tax=Microvirga pudoricolor TaxID=2778729 RepID=UPI00194F7138|nr:transporter substrate-binding domain-containing protein [Microvirga pudoricolor]MBM6592940.1 transporter substrate-binding domain-containing protein [Microvirga pudoricolor]